MSISLTEHDFIDLGELLASIPEEFEPMEADYLDGFLTALVCLPTTPAPSAWMPWVFDREGRDDAARHGVLKVRPERVEVTNETHDEESQQAGSNDGAYDLSVAVKRNCVLHTPAETRHAEGKPRHGGRKRTETSVKKAHDQPLTVKKKDRHCSEESSGKPESNRIFLGSFLFGKIERISIFVLFVLWKDPFPLSNCLSSRRWRAMRRSPKRRSVY